MARTPSTMLPLGTKAPGFRLLDTDGKNVTLEDSREAPALLVMFLCNHCPFVQHIRASLSKLVAEYAPKGLAAVAINSNDAQTYPEDAPAKMAEEKHKQGYTFPYLFDESQEVAKRYRAACTPDFYLFDKNRALVYRGQYDDSRPENSKPINGADLKAAIDAVLTGKPVAQDQKPSIGCNIKWRRGSEPDYFGA